MGLASLLLGDTNPFSKFVADNRNAISGFSAGFVNGPTFGEGLKNGVQYAARGQQDDAIAALQRKAAEDQAKEKTATQAWIEANYPQYAGLPAGEAFKLASSLEAQKANPSGVADLTSTVSGRQKLAEQYGLQGNEATMFVLTGKLPGGNDTARYGNAPIYAKNPQTGEYIAIQPGSDGSLNNLSDKLPPGFVIDPGAVAADRSAGQAFGTSQGNMQFSLPAAKLSLEQELANIEALKTDAKGRNETFGGFGPIPQQWLPATPATAKYGYKKRVEQVVGQNFLQAFQQLKGAGAITEQEGAKAQAAMARLDTAQKQDDFDQALTDLENVLKAGYARMQQQAGGQFGSGGVMAPANQAGNKTSSGVSWSIE